MPRRLPVRAVGAVFAQSRRRGLTAAFAPAVTWFECPAWARTGGLADAAPSLREPARSSPAARLCYHSAPSRRTIPADLSVDASLFWRALVPEESLETPLLRRDPARARLRRRPLIAAGLAPPSAGRGHAGAPGSTAAAVGLQRPGGARRSRRRSLRSARAGALRAHVTHARSRGRHQRIRSARSSWRLPAFAERGLAQRGGPAEHLCAGSLGEGWYGARRANAARAALRDPRAARTG